MSRLRKSIPKEVQTAQQRVNGMVSVDERLDLGSGVSVETLTASVTAVTDAISEYNTMLAQVDEKSNEIDAMVKRMNDLATRALKGAEFKFGGDSNEFEMIGGTRKSDRKRPTRKNGGGTGAVK